MEHPIRAINITAATIIIQFVLLVIFSIGALFFRAERPDYRYRWPSSWSFPTIILTFALLTIGCLLISDEFSKVWKPVFGKFNFDGIQWSTGLFLLFTLDIIWVSIMVAGTGGSTLSAFTPVYFVIPALAIFLRESLEHIVFYLCFVAISFSWNLSFKIGHYDKERSFPRLAYWFVAIASLVLATIIGYVTRPQ